MIFRSSDLPVPIPEMPLCAYVAARFGAMGDRPAIIDGSTGRLLTYAQLAGGIRRMAIGLVRRGMRKGDVFAILLPNLPEYAVVFLGVASAGGTATTINPLMTAEEIHRQLRDTGARWLLTIAPLAGRAREGADNTDVREIFCLEEVPGTTPYASLLAEDGPPPEVVIEPRRHLVLLPLSSGTGGLPKAVMLTHHNVVAQLCQANSVHAGEENGCVAGVGTFSHVMGMTAMLLFGLQRGNTIVALPRFELELFLQCVQKYRVRYASLVPSVIRTLARDPLVDRYDRSSLKWVSSGSAPLDAELEEICARRLNCRLGQRWGMTELSGVGASSRLSQNPPSVRRGATGRLWPNMEARIVDTASGADLGTGRAGVLLVRGPNVTAGYLKSPGAAADTLDANGWLNTGDIASFDADGYLFITDRAKELIKYKGYQIAPAELEAVLVSHPAVAEAAVIPSPDSEHGEVPKAFVVLEAHASPEQLLAYVAERVAPYKKLRRLEIVDHIPRSPTGKLLRRVLVERERASARQRG